MDSECPVLTGTLTHVAVTLISSSNITVSYLASGLPLNEVSRGFNCKLSAFLLSFLVALEILVDYLGLMLPDKVLMLVLRHKMTIWANHSFFCVNPAEILIM